MGRHHRPSPRGAHRASGRTIARVAVILAAVATLAVALLVSNIARDATLADGPGVSTTDPPTPRAALPGSTTPSVSTTPPSVPSTFPDCAVAKAAGFSVIPSTDPHYVAGLDRDGDGFACDRHGDPPTPGRDPIPTVTLTVCPSPPR